MNGILNSNIKNFRIFRGITQSELAEKIGKSKNVISNWERGDNSPDVDSVEKICRALSVTPNQLYGWDRCKEYENYIRMMEMHKAELVGLEAKRDELQERINMLLKLMKDEEAKRNE